MPNLPDSFNPKVPEIYQVEVTNDCNFNCDFCIRRQKPRPIVQMDVEVAKIIADHDLSGSYFVEFQMSGEPLTHPELGRIIDIFKKKVVTGLSTNGYFIDTQIKAIEKLDYITISVDSITNYITKRVGGRVGKLIDNISLLHSRTFCKPPLIDLQIIEFPGWAKQKELLEEIAQSKKWDVNIRTVPDCFLGYPREGNDTEPINCTELCLNPFTSVSIQSDGDVVPCCFSFGKDVVYGNIKEKTLEEIWATSKERKKLIEEHLTKNYRDICSRCYMRSPVMLHWQLYQKSIGNKVRLNHD